MSVWTPSSRDPQKDKKLITEIGVLANAEEVGTLWEKEWQKKAQELFTLLDENHIVSKNGWTIKRLTELKQMIQWWKSRLDNDPNALFQASTYTVLNRDSELIQERIDLLQKLGNPKEEFSIDASGRCDVVNTVYHQFSGEYDFKIKMDAKSFYRWGDRITLTDYNNNEWVTVKWPKWTLIVKIENWQLVIEPMHLIDKRFSLTMTWTYTKTWTSHGLALTRRFVVDPVKTASTSIETEEELRRRLNDTVQDEHNLIDLLQQHWISEEDWNLLTNKEKKIIEDVLKKTEEISDNDEKKHKRDEIMSGLREEIKKKKAWMSTHNDDFTPHEELPRWRFTFEEIQEGLEINASLADVQALYQERAEHEAEEQLRKEYEAMPRALFSVQTWKPAAVRNRFRTFWFRGERKERLVREFMKRYKREHKDVRNPEMVAAADRIEREFATWWDEDIERTANAWHHEEVDALCRSFVMNNAMTEEEFEQQFRDLVTRHPEIADAFEGKTDYVAWNIVLKLREKKAYFRMLSEYSALAWGYTAHPDPVAYRTRARAIAERYIQETRKSLNTNAKNLLDIPVDAAETERRLKHEMRKLVIESNTMKIKLDVLLNGKSAYAVEDEHEDAWLNKKNWMAKMGNFMDKYPKTSLVLGVWWWLAAWIAGWWLWSLAVPTLCALKMIGKKAGHYLKEHTWSEKKLVRWLDAEHARLENLRAIMNDPSAGWFKKYRARRQYELYGETSHKDFMHESRATISALENALVTWEQLDHRVANALARLDYYHHSGHNFFAQQDNTQMEQVMNDLQALTMSGIEASRRAWENWAQARERIASSLNYTNTYNEIDTALRNRTADFQKKRRNLALKYGAACLLSSFGLQRAFKSWVFEQLQTTDQGQWVCDCLPNMKLNQQIIDGFALTPEDVTKLETMFWWTWVSGMTAQNPDVLRDMIRQIKQSHGMSLADYTAMKNAFMESYAFAMTENGAIEILDNAKHVVLDQSNPIYGQVDTYLQSKWIWAAWDWPAILNHIEQLKLNAGYLSSMDSEAQKKTAEYLYMFLSKPWATWLTYPTWGLMEASFHAELMKDCAWVPRMINWDPTFIDYLRRVASSVWMLTFANTYMEDIKHTSRTQAVVPPTPRWFDVVTDTRKAAIEWSMAEWLRNNPL